MAVVDVLFLGLLAKTLQFGFLSTEYCTSDTQENHSRIQHQQSEPVGQTYSENCMNVKANHQQALGCVPHVASSVFKTAGSSL